MESDESRVGYPEEAPPGVEPGGDDPPEESPPRRGARPGQQAPDNDDGKATGNRRSSG